MLELKKDGIFINGEKTLLISGAFHYFRTLPEMWEDRLKKIAACGFNTVETYVPWNLHEKQEGKFHFKGILDLEKFVQLAEEVGLYVILRPTPYICSEWENGGLPPWLFKYEGIHLRTMDPVYIEKINRYYDTILPKMEKYQITKGGPIIAMQIENEYGSYGNDKNYLEFLERAMTSRGINVSLFTSDGPTDNMLSGGTLPHIWKTINYGSRTEEAFEVLEKYQKNLPKMVMEFWIGWFDHWGHEHITREPESVVEEFEVMLKNDISVNFYMFHGGTNFGFMAGANYDGKHKADVTSYDYDALLTEAGDITKKYEMIKELLKKYEKKVKKHKNHKFYEIENSKKKNYGTVQFTERTELFKNIKNLGKKYISSTVKTMEDLDQDYGFILYETNILGNYINKKLTLEEVRDRAMIYLDGKYLGVIDRNNNQEIFLTIEGKGKLSILVENLGRINYGPKMKDKKGITDHVRLENQILFNWEITTIPLNNLEKLSFLNLEKIDENNPSFYRGTFIVKEIGDTFIDFEKWSKGVVYINGFNIGRYWENGPQKRLYLPKELLKIGENEIIIFELHKFGHYLNLFEESKLG